jgi:DnaK suppressor protein
VSQWISYHSLLISKKRDLEQSIGNREEIQAERLPDDLDNALAQSNREVAVDRLNRSSETLRLVIAALQRFETGEFGKCLECEEEISPRRLFLMPWAERCVSCQEFQE